MTDIAEAFFGTHETPAIRVDPQGPLVGENPYRSGTSEWWITHLWQRMNARNLRWREYQDWYDGTVSTWTLADRAHRDTFADRFKDLRANFAKTVVQSATQRMSVIGFDLWDDDEGSDTAWDWWQRNRLDARSTVAHIRTLTVGVCPIIVDAGPRISVEDPFQVITETDVADETVTLAALKLWTDPAHQARVAILYLPDRIEWWRSDIGQGKVRWERVPDKSQRNPWGVVPVAMLRNAPHAQSDFADVLPQLRLYAATLYNMATAAHYHAYPGRWGTGVTPDDEDPGRDDAGLVAPSRTDSGPDVMATSEDPSSRFGNFAASDLTPFVSALNAYRADIGIVTNTPLRLLIPPPTSVPPTGESVRFQDAPLTAKVVQQHATIGDGWEDAIRLAFRVSGDLARASRMDLEVAWRSPELQSEAVHADALTKYQAMGVPQRMLWRLMGFTPQQIRRMSAEQAAQAPSPAITREQAETFGSLYRSGVDPSSALAAVGAPSIKHTGLMPVTVKTEQAVVAEGEAIAASVDAEMNPQEVR